MELLESMSKAAVSLQDSINVKRKELYYWLLLRERKSLTKSLASLPGSAAFETRKTIEKAKQDIKNIEMLCDERVRMIEHRRQVLQLELTHSLDEVNRKLGDFNV